MTTSDPGPDDARQSAAGDVEFRQAARVILIDAKGRTLLFRGGDPETAGDDYWFTPGGGVEPGESLHDAARREVFEEVGLRLTELGPEVHQESIVFPFLGKRVHQQQVFFSVRIGNVEVRTNHWNEVERLSIKDYRWWTPEEIERSQARIYPENLLSLLRANSGE